MSDRPDPDAPALEPAAPEETPGAAPPPEPRPRYREVAIALAVALLLVLGLAGTAPFWAPALPWGAAPRTDDAPAIARIERLEVAQQQNLDRLEKRVGALETKPAPAASDPGEMRQQVAKLSAAMTDLAAHVERLDKAVDAPAAEAASRIEALGRALRAQAAATAELAARVEALDKRTQARAASETTDVGLVLAVLQIRNAVQAGRPFAAEFDALAALARSRPEIAEAAAPLAEPAKTGVASRAALARRLRELSGAIADAGTPAEGGGEPGWADAALERLRGLVTIRRVDGPGRSAAETAVDAAERALAGSDLAVAVAALDKLEGAAAEAAAPWLRTARERLAVDTALHRIENLLTARLGSPAAAPGSPG